MHNGNFFNTHTFLVIMISMLDILFVSKYTEISLKLILSLTRLKIEKAIYILSAECENLFHFTTTCFSNI